MTTPKLFAYLSYEDAPGALRWLEAIGFAMLRRQDGDDGTAVHSEVRMGDIVLMVSSYDEPYERAALVGRSTGAGLHLLVDDVGEIYERAIAAGACEVLDPEGGEWNFGTYEPGASW